ncbi:hypothetical protein H261_16503 [Paramagnetospirillum caucaseum]|uniref:Inner membrane component domain-containing protein n=1 Tax=Paramagnetospirillum caucaseum TaxID=1244869 RepID=M3A7Q9_9PROT|nr:YccF domain-containing protein [Paramagnetospirillum caucaseum]EME68833.1 hypothetical protein H261_16503 [Paramagnetospirillum caucaseum]
MRALGNILWHFPFLGFINAAITYLIGLLFTVTVVGAPLGLGLMELGKFYLGPFGRAMVRDSDLDPSAEIGLWKAYSWIIIILWFPFGLLLAVAMVVQAFLLCCTIIGIPLAIVVAKATGTVFNPVGKRCVSVAVAQELQHRAALRELDGFAGRPPRSEPTLGQSAATSGSGTILNVRSEDRPGLVGHGPQLSKGLKIGLAVGVPLVLTVVFLGPKLFSSPTTATMPAATLQPQLQKPAPVVPAAAIPPVKQVPASHSGIPEILDTATLSVNGQRLPLAGLRPVNLPEAEAAARNYVSQAGGVTCDLAPVGGWRCVSLAKGLDIAEVFALSGFAKAAANAPDFIRNAEGMARQNGMGVWRAS